MSKKIPDEIEFLKASAKGDAIAFETIVKKYQSFICAITFSATGDVEKSEELAQEAFISAWKDLAQLKDLTKFRSWLGSIARNIIRNSFRSQKRDLITKSASMDQIEDVGIKDSGPVETAITKEKQVVVRQALQQIPETYRESLVLFYRQKQSVKEVAELLELSEGAVRQRLSRGRKLLKEQFAAMVETTISRTGPKKAFTTAVIASITGKVIKGSAVAAAGIAAVSETPTTAGLTTVMSSITAKIITAAAVVVIGVGAVVAYKHISKSGPGGVGAVVTYNHINTPGLGTEFSQAGITAQEPGEEQEKITEEVTGQPDDETANLPAIEEVREDLESGKSLAASPELVATKENKREFKTRGVLSGLITDAKTGEPVVDAWLRIAAQEGAVYEVVTDANGFYYLDYIDKQDNYWIAVFSDEYVGIRVPSETPNIALRQTRQEVKHFKLFRGHQINIRVVDKFGDPVPGVNLFGSWMSAIKRDLYYTDANGCATLGAIEGQIEHSVTATHDDYALTWIWTEEGAVEGDYEIVMRKGVSVKGYAEYADGVPAGDLWISAHPYWGHRGMASRRTYPIDPNGYFTLYHVLPREQGHEIMIHSPYGIYGEDTTRIRDTKLPLIDNDLLVVTVPKKSPGSLSSISGTFTITGQEGNTACEYVYIQANSSGPAPFYHNVASVSPNEGRFTVDSLNPGVYRLTFSGPNLEWKRIEGVEAPSSGLEVELRYAVRPGLSGVVVRSDTTEPVRRFMAQLRKLKTLRGFNKTQSDFWYEFDDVEGRFSIETVGPGIYQIQIAADGFAKAWSEEINTEQNKPIVIKLSSGGVIKGKVVDEHGRIVDGATVIPLSSARGSTKHTFRVFMSEKGAVQTQNGTFLLENIPPGFESIKVSHPDYCFTVVEDIEIIEGETTGLIEIVLHKGGIVQGYVYDMRDKPLEGAELYFRNESSYNVTNPFNNLEPQGILAIARTDSNGFYRVERLPEQMIYVTRSKPGGYNPQRRYYSAENWGVVSRAVVPANGKTTELNFGGKPVIRGQLRIDDESIANTMVILTHPSGFSRNFQSHGITDKEGRFSFGGVPLGSYSIYYKIPNDKNKPWGIGDHVKIATVEMIGEDVDLGIVP